MKKKTQINTPKNLNIPKTPQIPQQTNRHIRNTLETQKTGKSEERNSFDKAAQILDNLDIIKKEIRRKFKRLTNQEMTVFSTIYSLEEQGDIVDYISIHARFGPDVVRLRITVLVTSDGHGAANVTV